MQRRTMPGKNHRFCCGVRMGADRAGTALAANYIGSLGRSTARRHAHAAPPEATASCGTMNHFSQLSTVLLEAPQWGWLADITAVHVQPAAHDVPLCWCCIQSVHVVPQASLLHCTCGTCLQCWRHHCQRFTVHTICASHKIPSVSSDDSAFPALLPSWLAVLLQLTVYSSFLALPQAVVHYSRVQHLAVALYAVHLLAMLRCRD